MHRYFALILFIALGNASVLLVNGDFEQPLSEGWTEIMSGAGVMQIMRGTGYDPDPDYELYSHKGDGTGHTELSQITYIPHTDLEFSVNAKFYVYGTTVQCWAGSSVGLFYLNASDSVLGSSRICARTAACPWVNSNSSHIITPPDTSWHNYAFNLDDELDNVPAVNRSDIAKILVSIVAQCVDDWGDTEEAKVFADNITLNYTGTDPYAACMARTIYDAGGNNNGRIDPGEIVDMTATIKNIGGVDFTDLNTTLECNDAYITITDNAGYFGAIAIDSAKENTSDPYVVTADAGTPQGHLADFRLIATDGAFVDTFDFSLVIGSYHYMIWNPDPTPTPGMTMHTLLTTLGYTGVYATTLNTENLEMYRAIFVCVGIYPSNYTINNGSQEALALVNYVNAGGNMYLEGGDVWYYDPLVGGHNFGSLFGILPRGDGTSDLYSVTGLGGTFTEGMSFTYAGQNSYIDHLGTIGTAFSILKNGSNTDTIGVANDAGTHSTVGASFELGGLVDGSGISTKAALLDSIMHFFGIDLTGIEDTTKIEVQNPVLQLTPNPFCNTINIRYSVLDAGYPIHDHTAKIYDATGRLVKYFSLPNSDLTSSTSVVWDGRDDQNRMVPDGIYFLHIEAGQQQATAKIILVR